MLLPSLLLITGAVLVYSDLPDVAGAPVLRVPLVLRVSRRKIRLIEDNAKCRHLKIDQ